MDSARLTRAQSVLDVPGLATLGDRSIARLWYLRPFTADEPGWRWIFKTRANFVRPVVPTEEEQLAEAVAPTGAADGHRRTRRIAA